MIFEEYFVKQTPALLILVPMLTSIIALVIGNRIFAKIIFFITNLSLLLISAIGVASLQKTSFYVFGGWERPFGIELKYDFFSAYTSFTLALVFWLFSVGIIRASKINLDDFMEDKRSHIPYTLMLLIESSFFGLLLTNDIFNLYVFLEIASLSSYPLISIGLSRKRFIYAFEYLMLGTLSATVMLLSIGMIFSQVGSLNMEFIRDYYQNSNNQSFILISLFILGIFAKLAVFPIHGWKINSYRSASIVIVAFFFASSPLVFIGLLFKFKEILGASAKQVEHLTNIVGSVTLIGGGYFAFKQDDYLRLITLSSVASIGYYLIIQPLVNENVLFVFIQLLMIDSMVKISLVMIPISLNVKNYDISFFYNLIKKNKALVLVFGLTFFNAAALPPSIYFFNKVGVLIHLAVQNFLLIIPVTISSLFTAMYFIRMIRQMIKVKDYPNEIEIDNFALSSVILSSIILVLLLFKTQDFETLSKLIYSGV